MTFVAYDPSLFEVETAEVVPSTVGGFVGAGLVGQEVQDFIPVGLASVEITSGYTFDQASQTLVYDSEQCSVSVSRWVASVDRGLPESPLAVGNKIRVTYGAYYRQEFVITNTGMEFTEVPEAKSAKRSRYRLNFSAQCLSAYAIMLSKRVCWQELPEETAAQRLQRWVSIVPDPGPWMGDE